MADSVFRIVFEAINKTGATISGISDDLKKTKASALEVGAALSAMGAVISAPFLLGVKSAATLEDQMARVRGIFGATEKQFSSLQAAALEMGRTTRYTATQAGEALQYMAMAGLSVQESISALPQTLKLAQAGALDLGTAADITTNILTAYRMEAGELAKVNDVLVSAFTGSNTNLMELGEAFKYVAPIAQGLGVEFNDLIATLGQLANNGIKGSLAGTSLRGALSALLNPTREEEKLLGAISARIGGLGLQLKTAEGSFVGFESLIRQLEKAGVTADEALELFGLRAGPGMAALLGVGSSALEKFRDRLDKSSGKAEEMSDIMKKTLIGAVKELTSALDGLLIQIGNEFIPNITSAAKSLTGLISAITEFRELLGPTAKTIDTVVLSFAALAAGSGALILAYRTLIGPLVAVFSALAKTGVVVTGLEAVGTVLGILVGILAAFLGPVGAAAAAIVALGAAGYKLYNLIGALKELNAQNQKLKESQKAYDEAQGRLTSMIAKAAKQTGLQINNLKDLHELMKSGQVLYDADAKTFSRAAAKKEEAAKAEKKAAVDAAKAIVESYEFRVKSSDEATKMLLLQQDKLAVKGVTTTEESEKRKTEITIAAFAEKAKTAGEYFEAAKSIYAVDSKEYNSALLEKKKSDTEYFAAVIKGATEAKRYLEELNRTHAEADLSDTTEQIKTQLATLEALYSKGKIATADYFETRKKLSDETYQAERENLEGLIKASNSEIESIRLRAQLNALDEKHRRDIIAAEQEQIKTEKELAAVRRDLDQTIADSRERVKEAQLNATNPLEGRYQSEIYQINDRYDKEIQRLQDLTVTKEQEAQKQLAIRELQNNRELELAQELNDKERALLEQKQEIAAQSSGKLSKIFENLYTLSGEHVKAFFILSQAAAAAEAIINSELAATKALAEYGPAGMALAALIRAEGYTSAAVIAAQTFEGLADGGPVTGSSPSKKADNILIRATAGEFMQPVDAVEYYGKPIMEALRMRKIPREILTGEAMSAPPELPAYASGGQIVRSSQTSNTPSTTNTVNVYGAFGDLGNRLKAAMEEAALSVLQAELR